MRIARDIEDSERAILEALLETDEAACVLAEMRADLCAGRLTLGMVLRNVEQSREAARTQRTRLVRTLAARRSREDLLRRLVALRLHPDVVERMEEAVRLAGNTSVIARVSAAKRSVQRAKNELIESNLRLVVSFARGYRSDHLAFLDLVQEGNVGLMRAVDKYDYRTGHRLSTYASWWIKQAMQRAIADRAPTIRVPVHIVESRIKVLRARGRLRQELGEEPTPAQLAHKSGLPIAKVELVLGLAREPASLDAPTMFDGEKSLGDIVANDTTPMPDDEVASARMRRSARDLLTTLDARERRVLGMRFGLEGSSEHTLEEIGTVLSLSRERVRQIEAAALRKLRERCEEQSFRPDVAI